MIIVEPPYVYDASRTNGEGDPTCIGEIRKPNSESEFHRFCGQTWTEITAPTLRDIADELDKLDGAK